MTVQKISGNGFVFLNSHLKYHNKEIYISSNKLTSKFVCNVRFCEHGCTEPLKIKARFFFIHQPLGKAISNSNRPRNGTTSRYLRNLKYNLFCHVEIQRDWAMLRNEQKKCNILNIRVMMIVFYIFTFLFSP